MPRTASVKYEDGEVSVWVGHVRVKRFPGVFVLQVYNEVEGALTFYGSSNGRSFLGFGRHYTALIEVVVYVSLYMQVFSVLGWE